MYSDRSRHEPKPDRSHRSEARDRDRPSPPALADPFLRSQDTLGNQGVLRQIRARRSNAGATEGGADPSPTRFPHADRILGSLGVSLPLSSVRDEAGCARRGALAFTDGSVTHFAAAEPAVHVAAHEAAHQVQHAGLTHDLGLGPEGHAGVIADAVAEGRPVAPLLGWRGDRVPSAVRNYRFTDKAGNWPVEGGAALGRLSDTGETLTFSSHLAYAAPGLINQASGILKAKQSGISIAPGADVMTVKTPPDGKASMSLSRVDVKMAADPTSQKFYGDCRQGARDIMGPSGKADPESVICNPGGHPSMVQAVPKDLVAMMVFLDQRIRDTPGYETMTPEQKQDVKKKAESDFEWLPREEKDKLRKTPISPERAKELGIDTSAAPGVGEAYAVFKSGPAGLGEFPFHYAAVILATASDRVTLENEGGDKDQLTANWKIETYGLLRKEETFQDEHKNFGPDRHTVVVGTMPTAPGNVGEIAGLTTPEIIQRLRDSKDAAEKSYLTLELGRRSISAWVEVVKKKSWFGTDEVRVEASGSASGWIYIAEGASHTFSIPTRPLSPFPDPLPVKVLKYGLIWNNTIGSVDWPAPYVAYTSTFTNGSAKYNVKINL